MSAIVVPVLQKVPGQQSSPSDASHPRNRAGGALRRESDPWQRPPPGEAGGACGTGPGGGRPASRRVTSRSTGAHRKHNCETHYCTKVPRFLRCVRRADGARDARGVMRSVRGGHVLTSYGNPCRATCRPRLTGVKAWLRSRLVCPGSDRQWSSPRYCTRCSRPFFAGDERVRGLGSRCAVGRRNSGAGLVVFTAVGGVGVGAVGGALVQSVRWCSCRR